jgi:phage terminase large subunit-like protein
MGLRGIGAARLKQARDAALARKRRLPWERKGRTRAQRIIAFLEWLPVTKGILAGRRMKLLPDQREFINAVYGPAKPDGRRRVALAIKSAAKGNGKTGLCAGLALAHLVGPEGEPRGEIYSASIDGVHARRLFSEMEAMILQRPELAALLNVQRFRSRIEVMSGPALGSIYEALSADGRKAQGLAPSLWIFDELAQVEDRTLLDGLMEGTGKRLEGLGIVISTQARSDEHPLSQLIDDGLTGNDRSVFVHLLAAPDDADPFDEEVLRSVNPAWGKFLDLDDLRRSQKRARRMPAFEPAFRNLRLNQRVDANSDNRIVTVPVWQQGAAMINRNALARRPCYGALDLSGKIDLTSFVLAFPDEQPEPVFSLLPFFWTPLDALAGRSPAEQQRFREWIAKDLIIPVPGPTVRFSYVAHELTRLAKEFDIQAIGYDRWRIDDLKQDLADIDPHFPVPLVPFGQGYKEMGPATEWFAELALTGRLRHGGHPVLTSAVVGCITISDAAGNVKVDKEKSHGRSPVRIDGAVAAIMALDLARRQIRPAEDPGAAFSRIIIARGGFV